MKWIVIIRPRAESDLHQACKWYNAQRPGLGGQLLEEIKRAVELLETEADRSPVYYRGFRRFLTHRFPYKIFYRIENNRVIVFRILHAKRDHPSLL